MTRSYEVSFMNIQDKDYDLGNRQIEDIQALSKDSLICISSFRSMLTRLKIMIITYIAYPSLE